MIAGLLSGRLGGARHLGAILTAWGPHPLIDCTRADSIDVAFGGAGTVVTLSGSFPASDPLDYCMVAMGANGVIPFRVLSVDGSSLTAEVELFDPAIGPGMIMLGLGTGSSGPVDGLPAGVSVSNEAWSWEAAGPGIMTPFTFSPIVPAGPIAGSYYGKAGDSHPFRGGEAPAKRVAVPCLPHTCGISRRPCSVRAPSGSSRG